MLQTRLPSAPWMVPASTPASGGAAARHGRVAGGGRRLRRADGAARQAAGPAAGCCPCRVAPERSRPAPRFSRPFSPICRPGTRGPGAGSRGPTGCGSISTPTLRWPPPRGLCRRICASSKKPEGAREHVLTAAALCFPASWTLGRKDRSTVGRDPRAGRKLHGRHGHPRASACSTRSARAVRSGGRTRCFTPGPNLHQPRSEAEPREETHLDTPYLRSERQCLLRLPQTGAILFSIHTYVVPVTALTPQQASALAAFPIDHRGGHGGRAGP